MIAVRRMVIIWWMGEDVTVITNSTSTNTFYSNMNIIIVTQEIKIIS